MQILATQDLATEEVDVQTPLAVMKGHKLTERIGFVPILRAGVGMVDAALDPIPTAQVWHIGLYRDHRTLLPVEYYNKLPDQVTVDICFVLDPMLATAGSAVVSGSTTWIAAGVSGGSGAGDGGDNSRSSGHTSGFETP